MFPFFEIFWINIYSFWLALTISFFLFLWMLKKLCHRFGINETFFLNRLIWYFVSIFFFSRLFYIISQWWDFKYIKNPIEFFIMSDYNFSLMWAIFGFFLVFFILLRLRKEKLDHFISWIVLSFFFVLPIWFIWALLWGQVYWIETNYWIEISYTHPFSPVPYQVPIFPLPIVYAILSFIIFSILYMLSQNEKNRVILAYLWLMIFSTMVFFLEFLSWKFWIFNDLIWINLNQISAIWIFVFCIYRLFKIYKAKT